MKLFHITLSCFLLTSSSIFAGSKASISIQNPEHRTVLAFIEKNLAETGANALRRTCKKGFYTIGYAPQYGCIRYRYKKEKAPKVKHLKKESQSEN